MPDSALLEIPIQGMDCAECTQHVRKAIQEVPGVASVEVFLASEKAIVKLDPARASLEAIRLAVAGAGYSVPPLEPASPSLDRGRDFSRSILALLGLAFGAVLFVVVVGEWLGLFEALTRRIPSPLGGLLVLIFGFPIFRNVLRAALRRQVIAHTLMTLGVIAALAVGEWATAVVVVFFMRVGDYAERFTTERARGAVRDLVALAPQMARLDVGGEEVLVPASQVKPGEVVVVRPGEKAPVDGEVLSGNAAVDQSAITGEALPLEAGPGARVFAASLVSSGSLRLRAERVGADSTFGKVIRLVEEAEAHRAAVQSIADRFSAWYLPVVAGVAALTFLLRRDPLSTAAVLVVACSCSFALATPIAMLASIGAAARRGVMVKGGKYLEALARADVLLIDKTGTLTLGRPELERVEVLDAAHLAGCEPLGDPHSALLALTATAERYSEHPLAEAIRQAAVRRGLRLGEPEGFQSVPGMGVRARVEGRWVAAGNLRLVQETNQPQALARLQAIAAELEEQGKTVLYVSLDGQPAGLLAAADRLRPEVQPVLQQMRRLGVTQMEVLTGDRPGAASALSAQLGIPHRAELLPEDKIRIVREYQSAGHTVIMVGDGVNDAPALAQADVGIAMGAASSDIAIEAAHVALMRADWGLLPEALRIARRTLRVVKMNIGFTAIYNLLGLSLAALGYLPPVFAAAAQSLPDLGILANSSRLLRQGKQSSRPRPG